MNNPKHIVNIWLDDHGAWQMEVVGQGQGGPKHYPTINVNKGDQDTVTFNIVKNTPATFAPTGTFCAQANVTKPSICGGPFTLAPNAPPSKTRLVIYDANSDPEPLNYVYVLNFNNGVNQLDPIFNNGGNGRFITSTSTMLIASAIILALIVGLIFVWRGGPKPSGGGASSKSNGPSNGPGPI